ncbi:MAG: DUF4412 domain-containing protein [Bacteroidia bacterium]
MKIIFSIVFIAFQAMSMLAQPFEGKITFSINFPSISDPQTMAMLPKEATAYYKGSKSRMEMNMAMGMKQVTISDVSSEKTVSLMDMMGQKYAIEVENDKEESKEMQDKVEVKNTKETKKIAGYTCTKAIITYPNPEKEKEEINMTVWFTEELEASKGFMTGPMKKIKGAILEYSIDQGAMSMLLSAKEVAKQAVKDDMFTVPADYKKVTQEELKNMMGGGR